MLLRLNASFLILSYVISLDSVTSGTKGSRCYTSTRTFILRSFVFQSHSVCQDVRVVLVKSAFIKNTITTLSQESSANTPAHRDRRVPMAYMSDIKHKSNSTTLIPWFLSFSTPRSTSKKIT